jgi:chromosome segregation ATPase
LTDTLDSTLTTRLRDVLARGDTTEADLRELTDEAAALVRELRAELRDGERRLRALNADPSSPITDIADTLRRVEALRPRLREARELSRLLDDRARELRTTWLLRQADVRRTTS